jgi:hypothetical protein
MAHDIKQRSLMHAKLVRKRASNKLSSIRVGFVRSWFQINGAHHNRMHSMRGASAWPLYTR